jgi:hypothetical protein
MKPQDLLFIVVFLILLFLHKPRLWVSFGLGSLILAMPLFATHVFFTAQRLVYYAAGFLLAGIVFALYREFTENKKA